MGQRVSLFSKLKFKKNKYRQSESNNEKLLEFYIVKQTRPETR